MIPSRCKILALQNDNDLSRFMANNQIHYISYARQSCSSTEVYRTADLKIYEHWLDAPDCFYPASGDPQSIIVPWTQYCSPDFLEWVNGQYGLADRGTCLVLKHAQFSEYVSVCSANPNADLHRILLNDSDLKRALVQTIRSKASQSTRRHVPRHFNEVGVKRPRDHFLGSTDKSEADIKRLTCSTSFVVGNNGVARLSSKEKIVLIEMLTLKPAKNIASLHHCSIKTVERIMSRIRLKLSVSSRHEMYLVAKRNHLI